MRSHQLPSSDRANQFPPFRRASPISHWAQFRSCWPGARSQARTTPALLSTFFIISIILKCIPAPEKSKCRPSPKILSNRSSGPLFSKPPTQEAILKPPMGPAFSLLRSNSCSLAFRIPNQSYMLAFQSYFPARPRF